MLRMMNNPHADATALIVLARGGAFEVDVTEAPNTIAGYVARPPGTVVTLSNGLVRAYSRAFPDGVDLGSARGVFPLRLSDVRTATPLWHRRSYLRKLPGCSRKTALMPGSWRMWLT